jgi:hypothetical protein
MCPLSDRFQRFSPSEIWLDDAGVRVRTQQEFNWISAGEFGIRKFEAVNVRPCADITIGTTAVNGQARQNQRRDRQHE